MTRARAREERNGPIGTPETCLERMKALEEGAGLPYGLVIVSYGRLPQRRVLASFDLFAKEVLPHFSGAEVGLSPVLSTLFQSTTTEVGHA